MSELAWIIFGFVVGYLVGCERAMSRKLGSLSTSELLRLRDTIERRIIIKGGGD